MSAVSYPRSLIGHLSNPKPSHPFTLHPQPIVSLHSAPLTHLVPSLCTPHTFRPFTLHPSPILSLHSMCQSPPPQDITLEAERLYHQSAADAHVWHQAARSASNMSASLQAQLEQRNADWQVSVSVIPWSRRTDMSHLCMDGCHIYSTYVHPNYYVIANCSDWNQYPHLGIS